MTDKIFVKPGVGVKVPLPIPGGGKVPAEGCLVEPNMHVRRLINTGDLVACAAPEPGAPVEMRTKNFPLAETPAKPAPPAAPAAAVKEK